MTRPTTPAAEDHVTGVPGLATWGRVYLFVVLCFVIWVGALAALMHVFS